MGYSSARQKFESAKASAQDSAIHNLAEGLVDLARAIEDDINKLERQLQTITNRVNSLR
jgi:uncharacterized coiled-coil protein SlyX